METKISVTYMPIDNIHKSIIEVRCGLSDGIKILGHEFLYTVDYRKGFIGILREEPYVAAAQMVRTRS